MVTTKLFENVLLENIVSSLQRVIACKLHFYFIFCGDTIVNKKSSLLLV